MDRIYRLQDGGEPFYAVERDGRFWRAAPRTDGIFGGYDTADPMPGGLQGLRVLAPVRPSKIVCVGLNYRDHALEVGKALPAEPLLFIKPASSVVGPEDEVGLPSWCGRIEHEAELAVVIRRRARRVSAADAMDYVLGITCLNDVTARELQRKEIQYTRAKGFDSFAPMGPCIAAGLDASSLGIEGWVNGEKKQSSNTNQLIFPIERLVEFVSNVMTLNPGDVITTGTPSGVGPLRAGDRVTVKIEGIGELSNPVVER
jgi:2-keto-4-pentenoate hydratase/2-oxohepta-3-ene-1,7-dioic acid hydratase in catechol pathway